MKKLLVVGYGFVTKCFIDRYKHIYKIDIVSERSDITDPDIGNTYCKVEDLKNMQIQYDVVVIAAYKKTYTENINLIDYIYRAIRTKAIIYVGSAAIYDIENTHTTELSGGSKINVLYGNIKKKLDSCVKNYCLKSKIPTVILNPSVITGRGGAWFKSINHQLRYKEIQLPNNGKSEIKVISVNDFALVLKIIIDSEIKNKYYEEYIVTSDVHITWYDLYSRHAVDKGCQFPNIKELNTRNKFYDNPIKNKLFYVIYKAPLILQILFEKLRLALSRVKKNKETGYIESDENFKCYIQAGYYRYFMSANSGYDNEKLKAAYSIKSTDFEGNIL